jgi:outer membrane protein TolC
VAEAQSALTRAENTVQLERARLAKALALPAGADIKVVESLDPRPEMPDSAASYSEAAENRPDLKAARLRVDQTKADRKAALTSKLPFLSHSFNRSFSRSPGDGVVDFDVAAGEPIIGHITETLSSWNYRIGVTWNILDGLVTEGNIQRAKALVLSAEHELADLDLQVGLEVKQALLTVRDARQQIVTAREALVAAEEDLKLSQERYSVGLGTILELIDAQVKRTRARTGEVQAMAQLKRAEAQLDKATGRRAWQ